MIYKRTQLLLHIGTGGCIYYYIGQHIRIVILRPRRRKIGRLSSARPRGGSEHRLLLGHLVHLAPVAAGVDAVVDLGDLGRGDRRVLTWEYEVAPASNDLTLSSESEPEVQLWKPDQSRQGSMEAWSIGFMWRSSGGRGGVQA